jgi:NTE family protein
MRPVRSIAAVCVLTALLTGVGRAQPAAANAPDADDGTACAERPAVGLVLSGGGARGGAHLGVLIALEELRIPVDYIAGTSIGAAIGGIYASGLSTDEIEEFVRSIDWNAAFLNLTPRRLRSFRRKRDDDLFLVNQKPGLNNGEFTLPRGVVQGQVIDTIMSRVVLPVTAINDFDDLAIPFRAVAGDIETGEAVVLGSGDLARAIRASMTVPPAIAPIEIDGRLLVDGGIAMNLPVEVAQEMGAERIIAIDISEGLMGRDEIQSVVDVTAQLSSLLTRRSVPAQLARLTERDFVISPDIDPDIGSVDFGRMLDTIQAGYDAVMARREELEVLSLSESDYADHLRSRGDPRATEPPTIDFVRVNNYSPIADSVIEARLREIEIGVPLDVDGLETSLNRLYGLELYQNVRYQVVEEDDRTGLELDLIERSWGPNYLQLGMQYNAASDQDSTFGLAASYLRTAINRLGGELRATIFVGDEPAFLTDLYQPFGGRAMFFVAPALRAGSEILNIFDGETLVTEVQLREATLELGLGRELMDWGEIRTGVRTGYGDTRLRVGDPALLPFDDYRTGELFTRFSADTLDNISFPREGILGSVEWRGSRTGLLAADQAFDQLLIDAALARTWGRHTVLATVRYDTTISGQSPLYDAIRIGGFLDLSGLNSGQLFGQHAARLGASYYRRIGDLALFPAFAGISVEVGNVWDSRREISASSSIVGGSLWAGVDTPVGPVYLSYGVADNGQSAFYVILGRVF